ncbi:MAG: hypothetical protein AAF611_05135 [Bacteroidota bacterium]
MLAGISPSSTNSTTNNINSSIAVDADGEPILKPSTITTDDSGMIGGFSNTEDETLDSVLGYFILIFLSVLVIILIDNRNLERRYKKLVADFKTKDPTI